jgi:hypothetical protein
VDPVEAGAVLEAVDEAMVLLAETEALLLYEVVE